MNVSFRQRAAIWLVSGVALTGAAYQCADRPWSTYAHDAFHKPAWAVLLTKLGVVPAPLALMGLLAVVAVTWSGARMTRIWRIVLAAGFATMLATLAVVVAKHIAGRPWPETWVDNNPSWIRDKFFGFVPLHGGYGYQSFPSGHTGRITAPVAVAWQALPRWRALCVLPLALVVAGLLISDFHFISDCIAGIYLGIACAWAAMSVIKVDR